MIVDLKLLCSLSEILEQVFNKLIVEGILVNTINITKIKFVIISFFKKRFVVTYINYVSNYLYEIKSKKIIARLISTLS